MTACENVTLNTESFAYEFHSGHLRFFFFCSFTSSFMSVDCWLWTIVGDTVCAISMTPSHSHATHICDMQVFTFYILMRSFRYKTNKLSTSNNNTCKINNRLENLFRSLFVWLNCIAPLRRHCFNHSDVRRDGHGFRTIQINGRVAGYVTADKMILCETWVQPLHVHWSCNILKARCVNV